MSNEQRYVADKTTQSRCLESKQTSACGVFGLRSTPQIRNSLSTIDLLSFCGFVCISLAFTVFAWGTGYKLSLYRAGHHNPPAKLCTRGSDSAESAFEHAAASNSAVHAPLGTATLLSVPGGTEDYTFARLSDEAASDLSPLSRAPILHLRPPPDEERSVD